jgi:hypothetical protein
MSKLLTLNAAGDAAAVTTPVASDILTTTFSTTQVLTGTYGLVQKGLIFVGGMAFQNNRLGNGLNPFKSA